jgi:hypothetical protein
VCLFLELTGTGTRAQTTAAENKTEIKQAGKR